MIIYINIYMSNKIIEVLFTNIVSIEYNYFYNTYIPIPYIFYFPMEIFKFNYIYKCDNTYHYSKIMKLLYKILLKNLK